MKVKIKVTYDRADIEAILKAEYVKKFGPAPEGYEVVATNDYYSSWVVEVVEIEREKEAAPEAVKEDANAV